MSGWGITQQLAVIYSTQHLFDLILLSVSKIHYREFLVSLVVIALKAVQPKEERRPQDSFLLLNKNP